MRDLVINTVKEEKLIVIVRGCAPDKLIPLARAMYEGGVRLIEITYSANGSISDKDTAKSIALLSKEFEGKMLVGAGTVLTEKQVELTKEAGGKFIISPSTDKAVIEKTRALSLVSMPGAFSPTEICDAYKYGADFVKLFPIAELPVSYVKAIRAPISHIPMLAVGGVNLDNIPEYLKVGICGFGIGSNITDKKMIEEGDFEGITALARKYVSLIKGEA
ncbi:MAG: bifunctional 4-hydroxy-2-oxoglutarate aldolase/2-dehydro-3-deoxy-phosphogluconate aldolase [Clostridia bacterium]|nr:bifunctional 4-hydroxy-2-oxoglutarate aldolase/2-dehydro-3-deoxy-phosphogluconate aldolase [Clostridia bacterium]